MINLSEQTKRILFVVFFVLFTVGTGYGLYYFFFQTTLPPTPPAAVSDEYAGQFGAPGERAPEPFIPSESTGLPTAGISPTEGTGSEAGGGVSDTQLLRNNVTHALDASSNGQARFYDPTDGRFYRLMDDGSAEALSDRQFNNIQTVSWGNTEDEAILEFPDGSNIYYDFETQRQVTLPSHWEDFSFSKTSRQITAKSLGLDKNNRFLVVSDPDGNSATAVYHLGDNEADVIPSWSPNNQVIAFSKSSDPVPDGGQKVFLLGKNHERYQSLTVPGRDFQPSWSPTGKQLLYSVHHSREQNRPSLWISDAQGQEIGANRRRLNLNTWAEKCTWADEQTLYCAVPIELPPGAGFDPEIFSGISDDIYKVNLQNGVAQKVSVPGQNHPVRDPIFDSETNTLTFTHAQNGQLYRYNLQ